MRSTRALVGSVGAGLCVVAAAVTVLFVLSAVVAVRGWPGIDPEDDVPRVTLADAARASSPDAPVAAGAPVAAAASAAGPAPIVLGGAGDAPAPSRSGGTSRRPATGDAAPVPATGGPAATPQPGTSAPAPVGDAPIAPGAPLADAIRDTGDTVGGVTDPVAPGSGQAVTQATDTVADTVDGPGRIVEKAAQGDVAGTVDEVTGTAGGLVGGG